MKNRQKAPAAPETGKRPGIWVQAAAGVLLLLLFAALAYYLAQPVDGDVPTSASLRIFATARVSEVLYDDAEPEDWTEGRRLGTQVLRLEILNGPWKGESVESPNYLSAYYNIDAKEGSRLIVRLDEDDEGLLYVASFVNYDRATVLGCFILLFAALLVAIGGKRGLMALLGLVFTMVCLWAVLIPLFLRGAPVIPTTIVIVAVTAALSLVLLTGFTRKTLCAILGCVGGVSVAGILAAVVGTITPINGFNMAEAEELVLRATDHGMKISGLLVCGILIASLGAVMDVAMSIASSCSELKELNPQLGPGALFRSGMNIGRDAMGTMANTLILAFTGSSLNTLILFRAYDYPSLQIINSDMIAAEIIQGISGSIGIILTVPLVAFISSHLLTWKK